MASFWDLKGLTTSDIIMKTKDKLLKAYIILVLIYGCGALTIGKGDKCI